jgi:hypothetical protein
VLSVATTVGGATIPLAQLKETITGAGLFGTKSLLTRKVPAVCVFTIVQEPTESRAAHVPLDVYPGGIGDSVAVQSGSPV